MTKEAAKVKVPASRQTPELQKLLRKLEETAARPKAREKPRPGLLLTNEAGLKRKDPPLAVVETVVRGLDPGLGNSYCCLNEQTGSYIQALCGFRGLHLERRIYSGAGYVHLRACYPGEPANPARLVNRKRGNSGQLRDLMSVDDVVDAFCQFYRSPEDGGWLEWRALNI